MALNANTLASALRTAMLADESIRANPDDPGLQALCDAIATAVVDHIISSAVVTIPLGVPVATTGTAAAQAGATTAPAVGAIT